MARLRVIVADDNPAFLAELASLLAPEFDVIARATDGKLTLDLIRRHAPDLAVIDLAMPGLNGIEVMRELAKHPQKIPVVVCSVESDPEIIETARRAGASAYVFKASAKDSLLQAVKRAVSGKASFP